MANCINKFLTLLKSLKSSGNPEDAIGAESKVYTNLVNDLKPLYLGNNANSESSVLHIGLFNNDFVTAFSATIENGDFVSKVQSEIQIELGICFADIKVYTTDEYFPQQRKNITGLTNCYYVILPRAIQVLTSKAELKVAHNRGKLLQDSYIITPMGDERKWNIGRGENIDGAYFRQNHIVFEDDSPNECNKYVSREHAHIVFSDKSGFLLYVDSGGRKCVGNRTRIIRDNTHIDLGSNMNNPIQLCNGDNIEFGKHAILEFRMI